MSKHFSLSIAISILAVACGGGEGTAETTDEPADTAGGEEAGGAGEEVDAMAMIQELIAPPEQPWSEMSHEDRGSDMVMRFEPAFRVMFQAHDAEEYADFDCASCHGDDMEEREYAMPSAHLPPVPPPGTDAYRQMSEQAPEVMRFMEEDVTPTMQTMLGTGATFTCTGCHPAAPAEGVARTRSAAF